MKPVYFEAIKGIYQYLKSTHNEGIHYWRIDKCTDCPDLPNPITITDYNKYIPDSSKNTPAAPTVKFQVDSS